MSLPVNRMDDFARRSLMPFLQKVDREINSASPPHHRLLFWWFKLLSRFSSNILSCLFPLKPCTDSFFIASCA